MSLYPLLFVLMLFPISLTLLLILLLLFPCFVLWLRLVVFTLSVIFVFSTNTFLTFFLYAFSNVVLSFPCFCRQLLLLLEFCKLFAWQYLLSNIFNGITDEIKLFFSLIYFPKNWISLSKLFMWSFSEFITLESRWYVELGRYCSFKSGKMFCFKWFIATSSIFSLMQLSIFLCDSYCFGKQLSSLSSH